MIKPALLAASLAAMTAAPYTFADDWKYTDWKPEKDIRAKEWAKDLPADHPDRKTAAETMQGYARAFTVSRATNGDAIELEIACIHDFDFWLSLQVPTTNTYPLDP